MALIADALLLAAALTAAVYCHVLAGRLKRLRSLDGGVGQAVAAMSAQVEEMRTALKAAKAASGDSTRTLAERTARAEMVAGRLELLLAALHDREDSAPVDLSERRRRATGSATRVQPLARDPGRGAAAASPDLVQAEAVAHEDLGAGPAEQPSGMPDGLAPEEEPAIPEQGEAEARQAAGGTPDTDPSPSPSAPRARRLFRVEGEAADATSGDAKEGTADEAAALRAALEALARETAE